MANLGKSKSKSTETTEVVIDASGLILGRLASNVAKRILNGEKVTVINAENAIISGSREYIKENYRKHLTTRTLGSQDKAPKHPRRPDNYVRRVVRGMLPWKQPKGKIAFRKLRVYIGLPETIKTPAQSIPEALKNIRPSMAVGELMENFGWKRPQ